MTSIDDGGNTSITSVDEGTTTTTTTTTTIAATEELIPQSTMDDSPGSEVRHEQYVQKDNSMPVEKMNRHNSNTKEEEEEKEEAESMQDPADCPTDDRQENSSQDSIEQHRAQSSSSPFSSAASDEVNAAATITATASTHNIVVRPLSSYEPSAIRQKIMAKRRRSSHELARDTKRILEICYGGGSDGDPKGDDHRQPDDNNETADTGDKTKKKNKRKTTNKKKSSVKKTGNSGTGKKNKETTVERDRDQSSEDGSSSETVKSLDDGLVKTRKKKKKTSTKKKTKSGDDESADDEIDEGNGEGETNIRKKKPRKKKKKKSSSNSTTSKTKIKRDAAGRIIRRRRKIKDRHKVVKKELIKKGKDVKINLETIVDDEDEYSSSSDDESCSSDSSSSSSSSSDSDVDYGFENGIDDDLERIGAWSDNDTDSDNDDGDDGDGDYPYEREVVHENDPSRDTSISTASKFIADESIEVTEKDLEMQSEDVAARSDDNIKSTGVGSVGSSNTDSSGDDVPDNSKQRYNLFYFCRNRKLLYSAILIGAVAAVAVVLGVLFAVDKVGKETEDIEESSYPPTPVEVTSYPTEGTSSPTSFPTSEPASSSPTSYFEDISTTCQTLAGRPNTQVFEAEDSRRVAGNLTVGNETSGYCGSGYVTNFIDRRSRLLIADIEVETTGFYTFLLRYSTNKDYDHLDLEEDSLFDDSQIILEINEDSVGSFDLIPTENSTTWTIDEIFDVLLKPGSHRLVLWSDEELAWMDPNVDWLAVQFNRQATRFEYLSVVLSPFFPDLTEPSPTQIQALVWLSSDDPADWSGFSDQDLIERYLLVMLYFSTNGDLWSNNNEWLSALHVCDWYGVLCWEGKEVTDLFLDDNQLFGTIPSPEISQLRSLVSMSAGSNSLEGTIGPEIGRLDNLERLLLDANFLTGSLPTAFIRLTNMKYLSLESNGLTGELPVEVFTLIDLEFFSVASNNINGTLPADAISGLESIQELDLSKNSISGGIPTALGQLTTLLSLSLGSNLLSGSVPTELGLLTDLVLLDISQNSLTGIWPPELDVLLNDTVIDYYGNDITE